MFAEHVMTGSSLRSKKFVFLTRTEDGTIIDLRAILLKVYIVEIRTV